MKVLSVGVTPENGQFQVGVLADGKNVKALAGDGQVRLFVDRKEELEDGRVRLVIHGECREDRREPAWVAVVSDSGDPKKAWDCEVLAGSRAGDWSQEARANRGRRLYAWAAILTTAFLWLFFPGGRKAGVSGELEEHVGRVLDKLGQEPGMERACREGERLFVSYERQKILLCLLPAWLCLFWAFWNVHEQSHGIAPAGARFGAEEAAATILAAALAVGAAARWRGTCKSILTRDCRPVTAAAAYLRMGSYGAKSRWSRFLLFHNGACGLYRSGRCKEAMEVSGLAWQLLSKKAGDYTAFVHGSLQYQCLNALDRGEEADREYEKLKALMERHPGWRRRRDVQRFLGMQDICRQIDAGDIERAEKNARRILGQWKEDYYRLPILGLMADLKEYLGKEDEEAALREEILAFSPENKEVRQVMGAGRLRYVQKKAEGRDLGLTLFYGACAAGIGMILILFFTS